MLTLQKGSQQKLVVNESNFKAAMIGIFYAYQLSTTRTPGVYSSGDGLFERECGWVCQGAIEELQKQGYHTAFIFPLTFLDCPYVTAIDQWDFAKHHFPDGLQLSKRIVDKDLTFEVPEWYVQYGLHFLRQHKGVEIIY